MVFTSVLCLPPQVLANEEFRELVQDDAQNVKGREEVDSIEIIDDIRFHISNHLQAVSDMYEAEQKLALIDKFLEDLNLVAQIRLFPIQFILYHLLLQCLMANYSTVRGEHSLNKRRAVLAHPPNYTTRCCNEVMDYYDLGGYNDKDWHDFGRLVKNACFGLYSPLIVL